MPSKLAHSGAVLSAYRLLAPVVHRLPFPPGVLARSLAGRRDAAARWEAWAAAHRGDGPLIWSHAASVGEQQVLEPVLHRLRRARPDVQIVQTHTSPSVLPTAVPSAVRHRDYLPWDERGSIATTLHVLAPALLLFGRGDLWPELVVSATARNIPVAVVGATVRAGSLRFRAPARLALRDAYRHVSWLGAVTSADADRWSLLGVPAERVTVTGDPRHDRILERIADLGPARAVRTWAGSAPVLVAGSVEPTDDGVLAAALGTLAREAPDIHVVVVPHDISPNRLAALRRALDTRDIRTVSWTGPPAVIPKGQVAIVTAGGLLADLYLGADVAYVGGGFRRGRLHAVAEPAAVGLPVIVGPHWHGGVDADAMVSSGGAVLVPAGDAAAALARIISGLAAAPAERARRGLAARATLSGGASRVTADAVLALLTP
jgi:3-deoxy-D-manno-octulosonic-acid transferase